MYSKSSLFQRGQSIVELLLVIGLSVILLPALLTSLVASRSGRVQQDQRFVAIQLLKETEEAVRVVRENGWGNIAVNGTYHTIVSSNTWQLAPGAEAVNEFTRQVVISDVFRDSSGAIVATGGMLDSSTKKLDITVFWTTPYASNVSSAIYATRHINNKSFTQTTVADFNAGIKTSTAVTNTSGGEVVLGAGGGGGGDWCSPNLSIAALDLPKNGVALALDAIEGKAFAGTGENASGVSFANVSISNTDPPVAQIIGTFNGYKTNDVFGETNYAYFATDNNGKEIVIIDIQSQPYSETGYFDASGTTDASGISVVGNVGYMIQGSRLRSFDLSSKSGSRPALDSDGVSLPGTASSLYIVGNYAYISLTSSSKELQIVDISNPSNLTLLGYGEVDPQGINSGDVGRDVFVNQSATRAYVVIDAEVSFKEFFIFDISAKTGSRPLVGSYETNGMSPKGVVVVGSKAIIVGTDAEEYQVVNITNEASPQRCGGLNIDAGINGIDAVVEADGDAYSYIITRDATTEFKIIEGGEGGQYVSSGTFESLIFDTNPPDLNAAFQRIYATISKPALTDIKLQVSAVDPGGSCSSAVYSFVGPDGTPGSFYTSIDGITISGILPFSTLGSYTVPSRCFRYKAFLETSDATRSPVLYDVGVNYSP